MSQCPGQDMRKLRSEFYRCPNCGSEVEIFSDEFRRRCPKCKTIIEKDAVPNCASWCAAARDCLGEERYKEFLEQSEKAKEQQERKADAG